MVTPFLMPFWPARQSVSPGSDDGNDRAILVQGKRPAQIVRLGHRGTPSIDVSDEIAILAPRPIAFSPLEGRLYRQGYFDGI